jgi:glycosyltransferase involved in cell wall biosynthesis
MKVSLINLNLVAEDAIGTCIINQVRFFRRRGDDVRVYILHPPHNVPDDVEAVTSVVTLRAFIEGQHDHFDLSDLYIYHYPGHYSLIESIRGIDRGTVIFYYHNVTPPELWGSDVGRDSLVRGAEGRALVHYADLCIADSPFNKQELVDLGYAADRAHVLPLAVPLEQFAPDDKNSELVRRYKLEGQRVLLFVGRMAGNKRIDLLVEALARVKGQIPNTKLLLVGDHESNPAFHPIVARVRERAAELGVAGDVVWTGRVDELSSYYQLADVFVSASLHEGFGVPLIEAMACGVPVVASRAGAMSWVVDDAGLICEPGSADDMAEKVLTALQDADLRQSIVERGLERVKAFGLEQYETRFAEIVDQTVTYVLPRDSLESVVEKSEGARRKPASAAFRDEVVLGILTTEIKDRSDIAIRGYTIRSGLPLVGPLIAWIRRNLTSHLREPYLDPMIERQVAFNHTVAEWMKRAANVWGFVTRRQTQLEKRVQALEVQVEALTRSLDEGKELEEH